MKAPTFSTRCAPAALATVLGSMLVAASLSGCASTTPRLDAAFGQAVREARAAQTLRPQGPVSTDPVLGLDGLAASAAQQRYQASFQQPPQSFDINNIGGGLGTK